MNANHASLPSDRMPTNSNPKKSFARAGWLLTGYLLALLLAVTAVATTRMLAGNPGDAASSGMAAFGDALIFLAVFAIGSIPPTGAALFLLRSRRAFWPVLAALALTFALAGIVAFIAWFVNPRSVAAGLGFMRILLAPLAALLCLLGGLFAPRRGAKITLFAAAAVEALMFGGWVITCVLRNR